MEKGGRHLSGLQIHSKPTTQVVFSRSGVNLHVNGCKEERQNGLDNLQPSLGVRTGKQNEWQIRVKERKGEKKERKIRTVK